MRAFRPYPGLTKVVAATGTSSATTLTGIAKSGPIQLEIYNAASVTAFVKMATGTSAATVTDSYPVPAGATRLITIQDQERTANVILASSTGNVYLTPGDGL